MDAKAFVQELADTGCLEDQTKVDYSKPINFNLDYKSDEGPFLEPFFEKLAGDIEKSEVRKNCRSRRARTSFYNSAKALILNVMHVRQLLGDNLYIAISLNKNTYGLDKRYAPRGISYMQFKAAFDGLTRLGLIGVHKKGYLDTVSGEGFCTRICATEKLIGQFDDYVSGYDVVYVREQSSVENEDEVIILRAPDKRLQDYKDNRFTKRARKNLAIINSVLIKHEISLPLIVPEDKKRLKSKVLENYSKNLDGQQPFIDFEAVRLYRIFSDGSFTKGGRFYRVWWQSIPKEFRPFIEINGKPTVEIDYKNLHPAILYAQQGIELDFDAYDIHHKVKRDISKQAFNALLNAKGKPNRFPEFDEDTTGISWEDYLALIQTKHQVLADADKFLHGYGLELQFLDSELAESIMLYFAKRNIPCLPVHDSFIICKEYADELESVMISEYKKEFNIPIEVKRG